MFNSLERQIKKNHANLLNMRLALMIAKLSKIEIKDLVNAMENPGEEETKYVKDFVTGSISEMK